MRAIFWFALLATPVFLYLWSSGWIEKRTVRRICRKHAHVPASYFISRYGRVHVRGDNDPHRNPAARLMQELDYARERHRNLPLVWSLGLLALGVLAL